MQAPAAQLVDDLRIESSGVQLKGIAGEVRVHRLRGAPRGQLPTDARPAVDGPPPVRQWTRLAAGFQNTLLSGLT